MTGEAAHKILVEALVSQGCHYAGKCPVRVLASQHDPAGCADCSRLIRPWHELQLETQELFCRMWGLKSEEDVQ